MALKRRTAEVVLAVCFAVAILAGGVAFYLDATESRAHSDPAAVLSTVGVEPDERYAGAVDDARSRARLLLVQENLPSVSVAVARDGDIVWSEAFGVANVGDSLGAAHIRARTLGLPASPISRAGRRRRPEHATVLAASRKH